MARRVIVLAASALVIASALAAPLPKEAERPLYFPDKVGATRVWSRFGDDSEFTEVVTAVERTGGLTVVTVKVTMDGRPLSPDVFGVSGEGVVQLKSGTKVYDPPRPILEAPYKPGHQWTWEAAGDEVGEVVAASSTVRGREWVEVPAGRFHALLVESERSDGVRLSEWHAAGVGRVKVVGRSASGREWGSVLKSFRPGKP